MDLEEFIQKDSRADPRSRYHIERQWIGSLVERSEDPYGNHLLLVHSLGRSGWKIFRMHRQPHTVPWTREGLLRIVKRDFLEASRKRTLSLPAVDRTLDLLQVDVLQRQLLTVLACDYRIEQQADLAGTESLRKAFSYNISPETILGRLGDPFFYAGRDNWFLEILLQLQKDLQDGQDVPGHLSCWMQLVAAELRRSFLEEPAPRNLASFLWEAWNKNRDTNYKNSIEFTGDRK